MPSTLPHSILNTPASSSSSAAAGPNPDASASSSSTTTPGGGALRKPRYVVSATGQAANPADIIASCREMQSHLDKMRSDAERDLAQLKESIRQRELAEKRRIAPGWLDSDVRVLEPERKHADATPDSGAGAAVPEGVSEMATDTDEGAELDRAFGTLKV